MVSRAEYLHNPHAHKRVSVQVKGCQKPQEYDGRSTIGQADEEPARDATAQDSTHKRHTNGERIVQQATTSTNMHSKNGHTIRKSHTSTQDGCLSCVCPDVLVQGVVGVTRRVPGNITPYITPCRYRLPFIGICTQSLTCIEYNVVGALSS